MPCSERQILSDIGDRYCFWIWEKLLVVVPSSKKTTSSKQIDGAKHIHKIKCYALALKKIIDLAYQSRD